MLQPYQPFSLLSGLPASSLALPSTNMIIPYSLLKSLSWVPFALREPTAWHDLLLLSSPASSLPHCLTFNPQPHDLVSSLYPLHVLFPLPETLCPTLTYLAGLSCSRISPSWPPFSESP